MTKDKWLLVSLFTVAGSVGVASAQPGGPRLEKLDADRDGAVSTAEFQAGMLAHFTAADADGDGKVTAEERKAAHEKHAKERFAQDDQNGDGMLQRSEVAKMPDFLFKKLDTDQSGTLSVAELESAHPGPKGKAPRARSDEGLPGDADRDGVVTKAEATAEAEKLAKRLDADADGKLTEAELRAAHGGKGHAGRAAGKAAPSSAHGE